MVVERSPLSIVQDRVAAAAARAGRAPADVRLVVVTKGVGVISIASAYEQGVADLGENRVQELLDKQRALANRSGIRWHLIGTLQRNKVRAVVGSVELIHSVDSASLAAAIGARAREISRVQDVLVQVNTSREATKHGVAPADAEALAREVAGIEGIRLRGLMTIAAPADPVAGRASFRLLRELRDAIVATKPGARELSMGMTEDFEIAIEEGATIVRIGSAIFGPRRPEGGA